MSSRKYVYRILFVCTGNSCRSPMAEGLLKKKLPPKFDGKVQVCSAGTLGLEGNPATDNAIQAAKEKGADISSHRSQGLKKKLVQDADIIFAMAADHKDYLEKEFPGLRENVFLLRTFGREGQKIKSVSIKDPIGGDMQVYRRCCNQINSELDRILPLLSNLIEQKMEHEENFGPDIDSSKSK